MKKVLMIFCSLSIIYSQDLIVTTEGDSIHCKVIKTDNSYVYYYVKYKDDIRRTMIPSGRVLQVNSGYYTIPDILETVKEESNIDNSLRVSLGGSWGYRTAKVSSDLHSDIREYIEELKTGYSLLGNAHYYTSEVIGYGLSTSIFKTENEIESFAMRDDISIIFIGPSVQSRFSTQNNNTNILTSISIGYMNYSNQAKLDEYFTIESSTIGLQYGIGVDFGINDTYGLTIGFNYLQGTLTEFTISNDYESETIKLDKDNYESLNRIDISFGLHFIK